MAALAGKRIGFYSFIVGLLLCSVLTFVPTPYVIFRPGLVEELGPIVNVEDGDKDEAGELMLVTVNVRNASVAGYLVAAVDDDQELYEKKKLYPEGQSQESYYRNQDNIMLSSQSSAIRAAYNAVGVGYDIESIGIAVSSVAQGFPAYGVLEAGDRITKLDGEMLASREELLNRLAAKQVGDTVSLTFTEDGEEDTVELKLAALDDLREDGTPRPGLGISVYELQIVSPHDERNQVEIEAGDIGGPSAGLMFSLEIYNQLTEGDITKGYRIAGTGEISPEGEIGPIGGIDHKISAADREGADIFFAPADDGTYNNYSEAAEKAEAIGTKMKVVPVATMQEALDYLAALPAKSE